MQAQLYLNKQAQNVGTWKSQHTCAHALNIYIYYYFSVRRTSPFCLVFWCCMPPCSLFPVSLTRPSVRCGRGWLALVWCFWWDPWSRSSTDCSVLSRIPRLCRYCVCVRVCVWLSSCVCRGWWALVWCFKWDPWSPSYRLFRIIENTACVCLVMSVC